MPLIQQTHFGAQGLTGTLSNTVFPAVLPAADGHLLTNISVAAITGTISAINLPTATGGAAGLVIVGNNLTVISGTVSMTGTNVNSALGYTAANAATVTANTTAITILSGTIASKQDALGYTAENLANKNAVNGYAGLDGTGKISTAQLPAIAITDTFVVSDETAMLALTVETGDVAVRTDLNKSFILKGVSGSVLGDWQELLTPTDLVSSVNGMTGPVTLTTTNISEGSNLYYTSARFDTAFATKTTTNLTEGTNLYFTNTRADARIAAASIATTQLTGQFAASRVSVAAITGVSGTDAQSVFAEFKGVTNGLDTRLTTAEGTLTSNGTRITTLESGNIKVKTQAFAELFAVGNLSGMAGLNFDYYVNSGGAKTLGKIVLSSDTSGASGSIQVDVLKRDTIGGSTTTLFTTVAKPTLTANGGLTWVVITGAGLPDVVALPDGCCLVAKIVSAPTDAENIKVELYEV